MIYPKFYLDIHLHNKGNLKKENYKRKVYFLIIITFISVLKPLEISYKEFAIKL